MKLRNEKGQAVVEYAIVFPIQLLFTLAIIKVAHIFVAKHVISYAAFCGARAALGTLEGASLSVIVTAICQLRPEASQRTSY